MEPLERRDLLSVTLNPGQTVHAGDAVPFTAVVADPAGPGDVASIRWDFNYNGSTFRPDATADGQTTPSRSYAAPGIYIVEVQATDLSGATTTGASAVVVKPADALLVHAGPDQTVTESAGMMGYGSAAVSFSGAYSDPSGAVAPTGVAWDFHYNGSSFNAQATGTLTPTWTYYGAGTYQAALQITDSNGATDVSVLQVTVAAPTHTGPTATAGPDQTINEGGTASFSGSVADPDGTVNSYGEAWDFHYDGSSFNPQTTGTLTPTHQFAAPGTYQVAFQATDSNGLSSLSTLTVTVNAVAPTVTLFGGGSSVQAGQSVGFYATASDPGGAADPITYAWDFNYDGQNFVPDALTFNNAQYAFSTPGTDVVAVQATDAVGVSSLATQTVTVSPSASLVAVAGADQTVHLGDTVAFNGSYVENNANATVNPSAAAWDFNYNGQEFYADSSAAGTLTPTYQFTTPGTYEVAFRLTDSAGTASTDVLYVSVAEVPPTVSAGSDQTVAEGTSLAFAGTAADALGSSDDIHVAWDFNYDGSTFNADGTASGTLTPTHTFTAPGTYEVALQVTDPFGASSLSTSIVTVTDVAPTATVTNSGGTEGAPVTFTVSNLTDLNPNDTVTYLADWTGSGQFQMLTPDQLSTHSSTGTVSFTHVYDDNGTYAAVIEVMDGAGGSTDYASTATVSNVPPTASFAANLNGEAVGSTPFVFSNVSDPSHADTLAGFTYYVSVNGGAYVGSASPTSTPLAGLGGYVNQVSGYVQDKDGGQSAVQSVWVFMQPQVETYVSNQGTGSVLLSWSGGPTNGVVLGANEQMAIDGEADNIGVTLLNSDAVYALSTNASFGTVNAAAGVQDVALVVATTPGTWESALPSVYSLYSYLNTQPSWNYTPPVYYSGAGWAEAQAYGYAGGAALGDGHVGEIDLPTLSTLAVYDRGDLGSIVGPNSVSAVAHAQALDVIFANLTGSITGLDRAQSLQASGWLGTSDGQQVAVNSGIRYLSAYGVGATVQVDRDQNAGDPALSLNVGVGGITAPFYAGAVSSAQIAGNATLFAAGELNGGITVEDVGALELLGGNGSGYVNARNVTSFTVTGNPRSVLQWVRAADLKSFSATGDLIVKTDFVADHVGSLVVSGNFSTGDLRTTVKGLDLLSVLGSITIQRADTSLGDIVGATGIGDIFALENLTVGRIYAPSGNIGRIEVGIPTPAGQPFSWMMVAEVVADRGNVGNIRVIGGSFLPSTPLRGPTYLVYAPQGSVGDVIVDGRIGGSTFRGRFVAAGIIEGTSIGTVKALSTLPGPYTSGEGDILLTRIMALNGNVRDVEAVVQKKVETLKDAGGTEYTKTTYLGGWLSSAITAVGGSVLNVDAFNIAATASIEAKAVFVGGQVRGGNIGAVAAANLMSQTIHADYYITSVTTTGQMAAGTVIEAQGGAALNADGSVAARAALKVALAGLFTGEVHFGYSSRIPDAMAATYSADFRKLLTFSDGRPANKTPRTWNADNAPEGVGDTVTLKDAIFQEVNGVMDPQGYGMFLLNGSYDDNWHVGD